MSNKHAIARHILVKLAKKLSRSNLKSVTSQQEVQHALRVLLSCVRWQHLRAENISRRGRITRLSNRANIAPRRGKSSGTATTSRSRRDRIGLRRARTASKRQTAAGSTRLGNNFAIAGRSVVSDSGMVGPSRTSDRATDAVPADESGQRAIKRMHVFKQMVGALSGAAFGYCGKRAWEVLMMPESGNCALR